MIKILILSSILLSLALLGMAFNMLFRKNGKFPKYQVGHNKEMHKLGITCVKHDETRMFRETHTQMYKSSSCGFHPTIENKLYTDEMKCFKKLKGEPIDDCGSCGG